MLKAPAFICYTGCAEHSVLEGVLTWSLDATFYALPTLFLPSASQDHGGRSGILRQHVLLLANDGVLECPRSAALIHEAAPDWQVVLVAAILTLGAASTNVADLKVALEVDETKSI